MENKTRSFIHATPDMGKVAITLEYVKNHFKLLASSEDDGRVIGVVLRERNLSDSDFKIVLEYDDIVIRNFGTFFLIYDAGIMDLYVDENSSRYIHKIDFDDPSLMLAPPGYSNRFYIEKGIDKQSLIMGDCKHDNSACMALKEYDDEATVAELKYGRGFGYARLMENKAFKYGTTIDEMKKHWRCINLTTHDQTFNDVR